MPRDKMETKMNPKPLPFLLLVVTSVLFLIGAMPAQAVRTAGGSALAVSISANPSSGLVGTYVNFQISLDNVGTVDASNIIVQEILPPGLLVTNATASSGTYTNASPGAWGVPFLGAGSSANLTLTVAITAGGTMTNTVSIYTASPPNTNGVGNSSSAGVTCVPVTGLAVQANQVDAQGRNLGPLPGATVLVNGSVFGSTDGQGMWSTTNIGAGTYTVMVTNNDFYPAQQSVTIVQGQMPLVTLTLATNSGSGPPVMYNFMFTPGNYFIPAMPGTLTFTATVAWNGTPGTANFIVNGASTPATLTDQGNGTATATLTVTAPVSIGGANQLIGTAVNGQGLSGTFNGGAYFEPLPGMISSWYTWLNNVLAWSGSTSGAGTFKIQYQYETNYQVFNYSLPNDSLTLSCSLGMNLGVSFVPFGGTFSGAIGGSGAGNLTADIPGASGVQIFLEGKLALNGTLKGAFAGLNPPTFTPGWNVSANIKDGIKAPAVAVVPVVFPAAAPAVTFLQNTWGIKSVVNSLKLGLTLSEGGSLAGVYNNSSLGNCFLKTTSLNGSLNAGLELEASAKLGSAKAKIYGGGQGTVAFNLCPALTFNSLTLEAYVGFSASAFFLSYDKKFSAQLTFGGAGGSVVPMEISEIPGDQIEVNSWEPVGARLSLWGPSDQLASQGATTDSDLTDAESSMDSLVLSNVLDNCDPSIYADPGQTVVLFNLLNANNPSYASIAIGMLRQTNGGAWTLSQVTDETVADCNPQVAAVNSNLLFAAWERIVGDVSQATNPAQVAGNLEIVSAWYDPETGTWSTPVQLTTNSVVDRDPLPVVFGSTEGILWIENAADDWFGDSTNGDSLLFSQWTGSGWSPPETLWSDTNGILSFAFVADGAGQGHVVFSVDQDGQWDTTTDRVLYAAQTVGGVWQPAYQLTDDALGDDTPALVAPNGNPMCVWNQGGTLVYSALSPLNPQMVYTQTNAANDAQNLAGVTMPGGAAVAYAGQTPDGVYLYSAFYNAAQNTWTQPRQLTCDTNVEISDVALAFDGTNIVAAYNNTELIYTNVTTDDQPPVTLTNVPVPGPGNLYVLTHTPGVDAGVVDDSLSLDPTNPAPDSSATVSATIENFGDVPLNDVPVAFYDGDPNSGGVMIGGMQYVSSLGGGATQDMSVVWNVPPGNGSHEVFVVVDPYDTLPDRDRSNNTNCVLTVLPDLVVDSADNTQEGATTVGLNSVILNQGVIATGPFTVGWFLGSTNGPLIASCQVGPLAPGQSIPASATWDTAGQTFTSPYVTVYTVADISNVVTEIDKSNNTYMQMVQVVSDWTPQITSITVTNDSTVLIQFYAANSQPSDFIVQSAASLAPPVSWQTESEAVITELSPGVFQAAVPESSTAKFYRVQTSY